MYHLACQGKQDSVRLCLHCNLSVAHQRVHRWAPAICRLENLSMSRVPGSTLGSPRPAPVTRIPAWSLLENHNRCNTDILPGKGTTSLHTGSTRGCPANKPPEPVSHQSTSHQSLAVTPLHQGDILSCSSDIYLGFWYMYIR